MELIGPAGVGKKGEEEVMGKYGVMVDFEKEENGSGEPQRRVHTDYILT